MECKLQDIELASGEAAEVWKVTAPSPEWSEKILPFLGHKTEPWQGTMRKALAGPLDDLTTNYFECVVDGEIRGNITIVESLDRPVGILQHVFTPPEHRRKGIAKALMAAACGDYGERGGRWLGLQTDNPVAAAMYRRFGFRDVGDTGMMVWDVEPRWDKAYFASREAEPRDVNWGDWTRLAALYAIEDGWTLRSLLLADYGPFLYEYGFQALMGHIESGQVETSRVLATADGAVVGHAFTWPLPNYPSGPLMVDFFVHPAFYGQVGKLLDALDLPSDRKVQAVADNEAHRRHDILRSRKMWREATLRNQFAFGGRWYDASLYSTAWEPPTPCGGKR